MSRYMQIITLLNHWFRKITNVDLSPPPTEMVTALIRSTDLNPAMSLVRNNIILLLIGPLF